MNKQAHVACNFNSHFETRTYHGHRQWHAL